jgi:hypothetical protein
VSLSELAECRLTSRTPASSWMPTPTPPPSAG